MVRLGRTASKTKNNSSNRSINDSNNHHRQQQQQEQRQINSPNRKDHFSARRSGRVPAKLTSADNDIWFERLLVVEIENNPSGRKRSGEDAAPDKHFRLEIRSYFESRLTGERVWDEPPSGASSIQYASEEVRKMTELQMTDLTVATEFPADDWEKKDRRSRGGVVRKEGVKTKIMRLIRRKSSADKDDYGKEKRKICYKPGAKCDWREDDHGMQIALARSMGKDVAPQLDDTMTNLKEKEAFALAKALSISERDFSQRKLAAIPSTASSRSISEHDYSQEGVAIPSTGSSRNFSEHDYSQTGAAISSTGSSRRFSEYDYSTDEAAVSNSVSSHIFSEHDYSREETTISSRLSNRGFSEHDYSQKGAPISSNDSIRSIGANERIGDEGDLTQIPPNILEQDLTNRSSSDEPDWLAEAYNAEANGVAVGSGMTFGKGEDDHTKHCDVLSHLY